MKCPSCDNPLVRTTYAGANVRQCENCGGLLLHKRRAESIRRRVDKNIESLMAEIELADQPDMKESIRCPECRNKMTRIQVKNLGFGIDECNNCSMAWFDAGELACLQLAYETLPQTTELNAMRKRLENMTPAERQEYERRIAELPDLGPPMLQVMEAAAYEIARQSARGGPSC